MHRLPIASVLESLIFCLMGPPVLADPPRLLFEKAEPIPALDALFDRADGWIGADGDYTVPLGPDRLLWLFSDTWVGKVRAGKRVDATIVNNTLAIQEGRGGSAKMRFIVRQNAQHKPAAMFTPSDGRGWFWLQAAAYANKKLYVLLTQVDKAEKPGVFGFQLVSQTLGIVSNTQDDPTDWRLEQRKLPCSIFTTQRTLTFAAAALVDGDYLYIYGTDEDTKPKGGKRYLITARVPTSQIEDFKAWQFRTADGWTTDFMSVARTIGDMGTEASVSYLPAFKQYVLVYTERGLSDRILARSAPTPVGPWAESSVIYRCPEPSRDKKIFCYAAKAHPELAGADELVVSYCTNSYDFWQVARDAKIYLPKFIRVKARQR
jgi:hypothetical protein